MVWEVLKAITDKKIEKVRLDLNKKHIQFILIDGSAIEIGPKPKFPKRAVPGKVRKDLDMR